MELSSLETGIIQLNAIKGVMRVGGESLTEIVNGCVVIIQIDGLFPCLIALISVFWAACEYQPCENTDNYMTPAAHTLSGNLAGSKFLLSLPLQSSIGLIRAASRPLNGPLAQKELL